jgi:hypothetical protein
MLRMTEAELEEYNARRRKQPVEATKAPQPIPQATQAQKKSLVITIQGKLPTWNAILAAGIFKRKKIRDEIHKRVADAVSQSFRIVNG